MRFFSLFLAAFLVTPLSAAAATLYVSTTGSDANSGTLDRPFATITRAAAAARAGDVVQVRGGVYRDVVKIASRGTSTARITFRPYGAERVVIDGSTTEAGTNLVQLNGTDWVDFMKFEVAGSKRIGICLWGAKNTRVAGNNVHHAMKGGIWAGYSSAGVVQNVSITDNIVSSTVMENQYRAMSSGWSQAVAIQRGNRVTIARNRVAGNYGEGIAVVLSDNVTVSQNVLSDSYSVGIYLDNAQLTAVERNFVYSTGDVRFERDGHPAHGIGLANETYVDTNPLSDIRISNNIVVRSRWAVFYGNYENGGGLRNVTIANNTMYEATYALLVIERAAHSNSFVFNNIFYQRTGVGMSSVAGSGVTYRTNNWYGGSPGAAAGTGDVAGNPQLVAPGSVRAADYKLTASSPLLRKGSASSLVRVDHWGRSRAGAYDIGAHELSAD